MAIRLRKTLLALLVVCCTLHGLCAETTFGMGAHVGTTSGLDIRLHSEWFSMSGQVGIQDFKMIAPTLFSCGIRFSGDLFTIQSGTLSMPLSIGLGLVSRGEMESQAMHDLRIGVTFPIILGLAWENSPVSCYAQFSPGCGFYKDGSAEAFWIWDAAMGIMVDFC